MARQDRPAARETTPAPGLLIVTGASHTGKTTVVEATLAALPAPAAALSVDDVLEHTLRRAPGDIWSNIPLAYDILGTDLAILLEHGWFVIVESTFTYVPAEGQPEFHDEALGRLIGVAEMRNAPIVIAQLRAPRDVVVSRAVESGRLDPSIVAETLVLHDSASLPLTPQVIDTDALDPAAAAEAILERLRAEISSPGR